MKSILTPALQPIFDLRTDSVSHYEALMRINGDLSMKGHIELIQMGERYGFIGHLDLAMLELVLEKLHESVISIGVNVSPITLHNFKSEILFLIDCYQGVADRLIVEITETAPINDVGQIVQFAQELKSRGCRLALDDYGNNQGSIIESVVQSVQPDFLKLDGAVLQEALTGADVLASAVNLAVDVGSEIVAEYVDSHDKIQLLKNCGIRYGQGYAFGKPSIRSHHVHFLNT